MVEKAITVPRSPCTWTVKPEGGHTWEEEAQRGVSLDVIGGMEAATTFIAPHQTPPDRIYVKKTSE